MLICGCEEVGRKAKYKASQVGNPKIARTFRGSSVSSVESQTLASIDGENVWGGL
jgi:hypothetical protein